MVAVGPSSDYMVHSVALVLPEQRLQSTYLARAELNEDMCTPNPQK